jgi:hypothetical protein
MRGMASDRASLIALRELIADTDLTLETIPNLPQNRTAHCRENLRVALALADDLIKQQRQSAAEVLGSKGGSTTSRKLGPGRVLLALRFLQFLPRPQNAPRHARNGSRYHGSHLGDR